MPELYNVVSMAHDSFVDWTLLAEGNKGKPRYETVGGDVVDWRNIKWFIYDKSFKEIQIQKSVGIPLMNPEDLPKAYTSKLPHNLGEIQRLARSTSHIGNTNSTS